MNTKMSQPGTKEQSLEKVVLENQFLDLFTYESKKLPEKSDENTVFENCTLLKSLDTFKAGENVEAIGVCIQLFLWKNSDDFEEVHYTV